MAQKKPKQSSGKPKRTTAKSPVRKTGKPPSANVNKVKKKVTKKKPPEEPKKPSLKDFMFPEGESMGDHPSSMIVYHFIEFTNEYKVSRNTAKMWCTKRWMGHSPVGGITYVRKIDFFRMLHHFFKPPFYDMILLLPLLGNFEVAPFL
jgi:hypothetical protein